MPPIHYLPHELSPMLKVLDDRVVQVVAMGTEPPSRSHPRISQPDMQVALMKTAKSTLMRLAVSFTHHEPKGDHHWHQFLGTRGRVEWRRTPQEKPKMWLDGMQTHGMSEMDWQFARTDAPPEAVASGHGDADYYVHKAFRDALLDGKPLEIDVYSAVETAAPAVLAADSIDRGSQPMAVPDFRPGPDRNHGQAPAGMNL